MNNDFGHDECDHKQWWIFWISDEQDDDDNNDITIMITNIML